MTPSQGASLVEEGRDITGETVLGMRVAAYREPVEVEGVGNVGHRYSEHWSTPGQGAERLFSEADVRHAFTTLRAERDQAVEALNDAVVAAYIAGATAVHENYQPDPDPEFTEAAHDYASFAVFARDMDAAADALEQEGSCPRDALTAFAYRATALLHAMAEDGLQIRDFETEDMWFEGMAALGEGFDCSDEELSARLLERAGPAVPWPSPQSTRDTSEKEGA